MTRATEDSLRAGKLKRKQLKSELASTRLGKGNTSRDYVRKGTAKSPYKGSAYSSQ